MGPVLFRNLAAGEGRGVRRGDVINTMQIRSRRPVALGGGEVTTLWERTACEQGEDRDSRMIIYMCLFILFFSPLY